MAKRFIDTSFYKSPFVRGLKGSLKGLYSFIICDCDGAGIWSADFEIASVYVGQSVTKNEFEEAFIKTGKAVDLNNGKYFFPDFIQHQYPKGLSEKNPAQVNFILELKKYDLLDEKLKPRPRPFQGSKVKVMVKDTVMEEVKDKEEVTVEKVEKISFELFWKAYDKKVGDRTKLEKKWNSLPLIEQQMAMTYIPKYILSQPDKQYRKNPETFLNNKSWNDEIIIPHDTPNNSKLDDIRKSAFNILEKRGIDPSYFLQKPEHG